MTFSRFGISHFRGFREQQCLKFGKPQEGNPGSGITYILGQNNSGKTTLVEGMSFKQGDRVKSSEKHTDNGPSFDLYENDREGERLVRQVSLIRDNSYLLNEEPRLAAERHFEIVGSRRHWKSTVGARPNNIDQVVSRSTNRVDRNEGDVTQVANALNYIESNEDTYRSFISFVQRIIPEFTSFSIANEENEFIEYSTSDGIRHKSDFLGDGIISLIRILLHLFEGSTRPLIIDEPELSLHPSAQRKLLVLIAECSENRQIVLSTHSPYFVSWDYIRSGATVNRVSKYDDQVSRIHTLEDFTIYERLIRGGNWQQPFLMDVAAKEIFFGENILFVEGQEDVGLLKGELDNRISFFGYGIRGFTLFPVCLRLARDLGIRKAGAILDAGDDENVISELLRNHYPDYKVIQWNRTDIRDKRPRVIHEKVGYFDERGRKKGIGNLDDFPGKIAELNEYFVPDLEDLQE